MIDRWRAAVLVSGVVLILVAGFLGSVFESDATQPAPPLRYYTHPLVLPPAQWAFGGNVTSEFSCTTTSCVADNITFNGSSLSLTWSFTIRWVVIYTLTNVSPTQQQFEADTAIGVSASYSTVGCLNVTAGQPCETESAVISLGGVETSDGYTNVTNGSVHLSAGPGSPATIAALAVTNASSTEAFNFSGSEQASLASTPSPVTLTFDLGGSESSSIRFASPLGIVPTAPVPTDVWNSSAPFTASGGWKAGYSYSTSEYGVPYSTTNWTHGAVEPSGTLDVTGSDVGQSTLWDNYTSPHSQATVQGLVLGFSGGNFSGSDGWILVPTDVYSGLLGSFGLDRSAGGLGPALATLAPAAGNVTVSSSESVYYATGAGFVGSSVVENVSALPGGNPGSASVSLHAGPEPVSVAQAQYSAITATSSGRSNNLLLIVATAVAGVAVVGGVVGAYAWRRHARARRPPSAAEPPTWPPGTPPR